MGAPCKGIQDPWGTQHMKGAEMLVRNLELNP